MFTTLQPVEKNLRSAENLLQKLEKKANYPSEWQSKMEKCSIQLFIAFLGQYPWEDGEEEIIVKNSTWESVVFSLSSSLKKDDFYGSFLAIRCTPENGLCL